MFIPKAVKKILHTFQNEGYSTYLVGGCVRDHFLSRKQSDFDLATSATPDEVIRLFRKTVPTGLKHGTVTVIEDGMHCEVTTFRTDGQYDGRRPQSVDFTPHIEVDLARRDFTINAIAYDGDNYVDPFGGLRDLRMQLIRAVGNPSCRFQEDGLRMLRAIRFAAQLGFAIEEQTKLAVIEHKSILTRIAHERIRDELDKILMSEHPSVGLKLLKELQLIDFVLPEMNDTTEDQFRHTLAVVEHTQITGTLRLAALLLFVPKHQQVLRRLKYDRKTIHTVSTILRELSVELNNLSRVQVKKWLHSIGSDIVHFILNLQEAMQKSGLLPMSNLDDIKRIRRMVKQILSSGEPIYIKDLAINGNDLIQMGIKEGQTIGSILSALLEEVWVYPNMNQKDQLLKYIIQMEAHKSNTKE